MFNLYEINTPIGTLVSLFSRKGLSLLIFKDGKNFENHIKRFKKFYSEDEMVSKKDRRYEILKTQIEEYFSGERKNFNIDVDLRGTDFQKLVWNQLAKIPYGTLISYQRLSREVGREKSVRAVANALGQNRILLLIPCHRVIRKNGNIGGFGGGVWRKKFLIDLEKRI